MYVAKVWAWRLEEVDLSTVRVDHVATVVSVEVGNNCAEPLFKRRATVYDRKALADPENAKRFREGRRGKGDALRLLREGGAPPGPGRRRERGGEESCPAALRRRIELAAAESAAGTPGPQTPRWE